MRKVILLALLTAVVSVGLGLASQDSSFLTGNLKGVKGIATTENGSVPIYFSGAIGLKAVPSARGMFLYLTELNLVSKGIRTVKGTTGVLGLRLGVGETGLSYDLKTGRATGEIPLILHYELLDRVKGFRKAGTEGEDDQFVPFTEKMKGKIVLKLPPGTQLRAEGAITASLELEMELSSFVLSVVRRIVTSARFRLDWSRFLAPALFLRIQPVFIGRNSSDPTATGTAFTELMKRAVELWDRCGNTNCIKFILNRPIYLSKPAYRVLETKGEAASLRAEVDVADAVEVFVVERMDFTCDWGGGACFSSGTAAAKIVTCDRQLAVPAPCPCPGYCPGTCPPCPPCRTGAVNHYHLAHELGHALNLAHPHDAHGGLVEGTLGSNMEPSGFCCDNPDSQSARNCRSASNPLLF